MESHGERAGAAARRRGRRLRAWHRHVRTTVAMELATALHHSTQRVEVPREGEVRETHDDLRAQNRPLPGPRPAPLLEVLPQVGAQRHAVDQIVDAVPGLPMLDGPVPLMVEQLVDVLQLLDALIPVAEQVIEVPKIIIECIPPRTSAREPQLAEQLVEVPTIVSFSSLQRIMEQTVDIPVPQGGGRHADLQGFLRGQSSTGAEQTVDIPGGGLQGSRPGQGSPASSSFQDDADEPREGVFRTFPLVKKSAKVASHSGSALLPESSPSTPAAQLEVSVEWVRLRERHAGKTFYWNRRIRSTVWQAPAGVEVVWNGERNEDGGVWYWHRDTRVSTFDLPPLPPG